MTHHAKTPVKRLTAALRRALASRCSLAADRGSITPLAVGFATMALALVLVAAAVTDIYLAHRKLFALADSAALAAAETYAPGGTRDPSVSYEPAAVEKAARDYLAQTQTGSGYRSIQVSGTAADPQTVVIELSARYRPALLSPFVPKGIELHAHADVRGALRPG